MEGEEQLGWYSGIEPVDVGTLEDVKEIRQVIPATKGVELLIEKAEIKSNKENTYRSINLQLKLINGLADGKYKGKVVFGRVCYYADPNAYTKDFFKTRQHLVQLKYLKRAIGSQATVVDGHFIDECLNKTVLGDIVVKKSKLNVDNGQGGKEVVEQLDNEVKNFKALSVEQQV